MDRTSAVILGVVFGGLFLVLFGFLFVAYLAVEGIAPGKSHFGKNKDAIGVVEVVGEIQDSQETLDALTDFADDENVKAILLRIDSPGGAVAPSQEIYSELLRIAVDEEGHGKPVICSLGNMAASGGYYIAAGCNTIIANPGTLTGSIGVIAQMPYVGDVAEALKFKMVTLKSGGLKDMGNPFRPMSDEEKKYYQAMLDSVHEQFIQAVAEGRGLEVEKIRPIADGRVLTGAQALQAGLVDELGNFNDAVAEAKEQGKIEGKPELLYPSKAHRFDWHSLLEESGKSLAHGLKAELMAPGAMAPTVAPLAR